MRTQLVKTKKTKASEQFIDLYEIVVSVDCLEGVRKRLCKYRTKFTGKNYLSTDLTEEDRANGYNLGWGSSRITPNDILKVQRTGIYDSPGHVGRRIYFLEGQQETALNSIRASLDDVTSRFATEASNMRQKWIDRNRV